MDYTCFAWPQLKSFQEVRMHKGEVNLPVFSSITWSKLLECYQLAMLSEQNKYFLALDVACEIIRVLGAEEISN